MKWSLGDLGYGQGVYMYKEDKIRRLLFICICLEHIQTERSTDYNDRVGLDEILF